MVLILSRVKTDFGLEEDYSLIDDTVEKPEEKEEETEEIEIKAKFDIDDEDEEEETTTKRKRRVVKKRARKIKDEIKHVFIPKHEVLTSEEVEELILKENINPEKLPIIFISDPGIAHLEVVPGNIIKITRKNRTVGEILYYRKVIAV